MEFIDSLLAADGQTFSVHHKGQNHTLLRTVRKGGYFKLIMVPSAELGLGGGPEVTLVFSSKDLYFLGFQVHEMWYLFQDADPQLQESDHKHPRFVGRRQHNGLSCCYT